MDAVKFLKEKHRMCIQHPHCIGCTLFEMCSPDEECDEVKTVEAVEKWSKEHPVKTRMSEFLKHYPNARLAAEGVPNVLPCNLDESFPVPENCSKMSCTDCYVQYWLEEIE